MSEPAEYVLVGVDGSEEAQRAAEYGWLEASRRSCPLLVLNAFEEFVPMPAMMPRFSYPIARETAQAVTADAAAHVIERFGGAVEVGTRVVATHPRLALLEAARSAVLVVLGRRHASGLSRAFIGSTATGVTARSRCPVVIVPGEWAGMMPARIVVGVDGTTHSLEAVRYAFEEASRLRVGLLAVHAWTSFDYYVKLPQLADAIASWKANAKSSLAQSLAGMQEQYPDVRMSRFIDEHPPVESLLGLARKTDLLVVGTRGRGHLSRRTLGSVARIMMSDAGCPVVVVPHDAGVRRYDQTLHHDAIRTAEVAAR